LNNCTVSGNSSTLGGGISNGSAEGSGTLATVTLNNTTLSGNSATASGGAIWVAGFGSDPIVVLNNCTLSGNNAPGGFGIQGAGIGVEGDPTAGFDAHPVIVMANTILNRGTSGENLVVVNTGAVVSHGYNLSSDGAGGDNWAEPGGFLSGTGDIRNRNPLLGPLQNNGGPTMTHALLQNSPAINAGDPNFNPYSFNPPLFYDQRGPGFPRVVNGRLDIGAFESALR
jgi:predicted outer membrane repeat protein